jgi:acyl-CoA synthetase (AMP-forming)/AMP-acid ligase II
MPKVRPQLCPLHLQRRCSPWKGDNLWLERNLAQVEYLPRLRYISLNHASSLITNFVGLTETSPVVSSTTELDIDPGSSGSLLPGIKAKVIDAEGKEVTEYNTPGELYVQGPSVVLGYLNNAKATAETFVNHSDGRWMRTGDEVIVRKSPKGIEHLVIVDRIKELIKVKVNFTISMSLLNHLHTSLGPPSRTS